MAGAVLIALTSAAALARAGGRHSARQLCATVMLDAQPIIAARRELLPVALHALLVAHAFKLVSRVAMTASGRSVEVMLLPEEQMGPIAPPRTRKELGRTIYLLDPRWLARLAPDDMFLRHWSDALTARVHSRAVPVAAEPATRHLEPV